MPKFADQTPRYVPEQVMTLQGMQPVMKSTFYPVGAQRPHKFPINETVGVVVCETPTQKRYYECDSARINSELRMVIIGTHPNDEVRMKWKECHTI